MNGMECSKFASDLRVSSIWHGRRLAISPFPDVPDPDLALIRAGRADYLVRFKRCSGT
jgi:hypothetical protein